MIRIALTNKAKRNRKNLKASLYQPLHRSVLDTFLHEKMHSHICTLNVKISFAHTQHSAATLHVICTLGIFMYFG